MRKHRFLRDDQDWHRYCFTGVEEGAAAGAAAEGSKAAGAGAAAAEGAGAASAGTATGAAGVTSAGVGYGVTGTQVLQGLSTVASIATAANALSQKAPGPTGLKSTGQNGQTLMPAPDDEAVRKARAATLSTLAMRKGRQSTILSNDVTDLLGA